MDVNITLDQLREAQAFLNRKGLCSPLVPWKNNIVFKDESLMPSGAFKIRGATYCLSKLLPEQRAKGVVAYSTGNHAQGVSTAAKELGIKATIVMSPDALPFKVEATRKLGAEIVMVPPHLRRQTAEELAKKTGAFLVPPYDHPDIITGQGTIGLEILEEIEPAAVFVPVGGGGLIAGIALAIKLIDPLVQIIGVEPEMDDDACRSFKSGKIEQLSELHDTIADAVKLGTLGEMTFPLIRKYVDDMISVSEEQIARATIMCTEEAHLFAEPSGALSLAGALSYKKKFLTNRPIVCILSGGNTTLENLCNLLHRNQCS